MDKLEKLVVKHASKGAELILFPESFIPGYPRGFSFGTVIGKRSAAGKKLYAEYHKQSIDLESSDLTRLEKIAKKNKIYLVIGITEKQHDNGSLYCSMLYLSPKNGLLGVHRKIKPTGTERLIWAESDGKDLVTFDTKVGKIGGLICWENYMPLARTWVYQQGLDIYMAPTADQRVSWQHTMKHIALEGRCYVLSCNQYVTKADYPNDLPGEDVNKLNEVMSNGGSVIIDPLGETIAGPLWGQEGILHAELDMEFLRKSRMDFDPVGHYARNDVFNLKHKTFGQE